MSGVGGGGTITQTQIGNTTATNAGATKRADILKADSIQTPGLFDKIIKEFPAYPDNSAIQQLKSHKPHLQSFEQPEEEGKISTLSIDNAAAKGPKFNLTVTNDKPGIYQLGDNFCVNHFIWPQEQSIINT